MLTTGLLARSSGLHTPPGVTRPPLSVAPLLSRKIDGNTRRAGGGLVAMCLAHAHHPGARWGRGGAREAENHCEMVRDVASYVSGRKALRDRAYGRDPLRRKGCGRSGRNPLNRPLKAVAPVQIRSGLQARNPCSARVSARIECACRLMRPLARR